MNTSHSNSHNPSGPSPPILISICDQQANVERFIKEGNEVVTLFGRNHIGVIFNREFLDKYYSEEKEKDFEKHESLDKADPEKSNQMSGVTLAKCLEAFTTTEKLGPEGETLNSIFFSRHFFFPLFNTFQFKKKTNKLDPWYCSGCKKHQQATKKFDLWRLPQILVVHLKRFSFRNNRSYREKLETFVDYPIEAFDISSYIQAKCDVPPIYDLYACSLHYGGLGGGHYTAIAKNHKNKKWFRFDDSHVSEEHDESKLKTNAAYLLFYQLRNPNNSNETTTTTTATNENANNNNNNNNSEVTKVNANALIVCDVFGSRFFKRFSDEDDIELIQERDDIYA